MTTTFELYNIMSVIRMGVQIIRGPDSYRRKEDVERLSVDWAFVAAKDGLLVGSVIGVSAECVCGRGGVCVLCVHTTVGPPGYLHLHVFACY